eukprot:jgi/Orpsp1_1/1175994/evm.model.c7180000055998.1
MASTGSLRNVEGASGKKYGLIMPVKSNKVNISFGKNKKTGISSKPIKVNPLFSELNDDDSSDDDNLSKLASSRKNINMELRAMTKNASKQVEAEYKKAIEEDPNVYDYDEVYDSMKRDELERRKGKNQDKDEKKKPKYIASLLASAERRKKEQMRIMERRIQKEREEEGDKYKDKEMFVTSAYKEQQEELRRLEEEERKREEQEEANKGSMTGFYRNILNSRSHDPIKPKPLEDKNSKELNKKDKYESEESEESEEEDQLKEALNAGKKIALNDDNE